MRQEMNAAEETALSSVRSSAASRTVSPAAARRKDARSSTREPSVISPAMNSFPLR